MNVLRRIIATVAAAAALAGSALVAAPAASADTVQDQALVRAWYADFLRRDIDPNSKVWVDALGAGAQPGDLLWQITHSEEYNADHVEFYYPSLLGRRVDAGWRYWVDGANAQRFPLEWVVQSLLTSPEYLSGKDATAVVTGWYAAVLERAPRPREVSYWSGRVSTVGALGALRELYYTNEGVSLRITATYAELLDREPSAGEINYWFPKEVESDINVAVLIAATPEYLEYNT